MNSHRLTVFLFLGCLGFTGCQSVAPTPQTTSRPLAALAASAEVLGAAPMNLTGRPITLLKNIGYTVGYCEPLLNPLWVSYYCGPEVVYDSPRPEIDFSTDDRVSPPARLKHRDYTNPPGLQRPPLSYDRGHMAPSYAIGSRYGSDAQVETFRITNVSPQKSCLNQTVWEALESRIAKSYAPESQGVWVFIGPIFGKELRYHYRKPIPIPEAFYCIVIDRKPDGSVDALAVVMPQETKGIRPLRGLETTIDRIEALTGLDFFSGLPDALETRLEASRPGARWKLDDDLVPTVKPGHACR